MNRRKFNKSMAISGMALSLFGISCKNKEEIAPQLPTVSPEPIIKLSLAQWSIHKMIKENGTNPFKFAHYSRKLGFEGLEYVNHLYNDYLNQNENKLFGMTNMAARLLSESKTNGMTNLLIMVDDEGDLGASDKTNREKSVQNHHKWIDLAKEIGCHSIRVNLFGNGSFQEQSDASADSMRQLGEYAKDQSINILVENHGGPSSDPHWLVDVIKKVNMDNCGTLPDFGNFCIERKGGERWGAPCIEEYHDKYEAVQLLMPFAKAVSAKSFAFDAQGNEINTDYYRMLKIIKDSGYKGYIGVEYEGEGKELDGIKKTKQLLQKAIAQIM